MTPVQTIRADSLADALREVRRRMGRAAVILHTRAVHEKRWFGLRTRKLVEILAAPAGKALPPDAPIGMVTSATEGHLNPPADGADPAMMASPSSSLADLIYARLRANGVRAHAARSIVETVGGDSPHLVVSRLAEIVAGLLRNSRDSAGDST